MKDAFRLEAEYYDKIWGSADRYEAEAKSLDQILKKHRIHRILDLGCGTGGHCLELAKLSYDMVGLDISETMLGKARERSSKLDVQAEFVLSDMVDAYSSLQNAKITLPFDAAICMGHSLAHVLDDESFSKVLNEMHKVLKQEGIFIFCVRNARHLRDDRIGQIRMDTLINEPDLQLAQLCYNFRDDKSKDILIWNAIWLIKDQGEIDFQIRTHPLRWYRYDDLTEILETHGFILLHAYGDTLGHELFDNDKHETIFMICQKE